VPDNPDDVSRADLQYPRPRTPALLEGKAIKNGEPTLSQTVWQRSLISVKTAASATSSGLGSRVFLFFRLLPSRIA
jgi:hypothetical protein